MFLGANKNRIELLREQVVYKHPQSIPRWHDYVPLPTGLDLIDNQLLIGGLPIGCLIEIVGSKSSGKSSFLFMILSGLTTKGKNIAYFDFSGTFYPPSALRSGVDLNRILILKPQNIAKGLRAAEILFRNGGTDVAVFDVAGTKEKISKALLLRLKKSITQSRGIGIFLREPDSTSIERNKIALCLKVENIKGKKLIKIDKTFFAIENKSVEFSYD